ncbi:MAG TPA: cytochrome-c oxidase [Stellaceae bacterium]|nr:cytochrome-c oxidase [Stellaceae bacterium]
MVRLDGLFLRVAVLYVLSGMGLGIFMAMTQDHSMMPAHAHINLVGWVSMALYALVYRAWPEAAEGGAAWTHFWLANIGTLTLVIGVSGIYAGYPESFEAVAGVGSILTLLSMLLFAAIVFRRVPMLREGRRAKLPEGRSLGAVG